MTREGWLRVLDVFASFWCTCCDGDGGWWLTPVGGGKYAFALKGENLEWVACNRRGGAGHRPGPARSATRPTGVTGAIVLPALTGPRDRSGPGRYRRTREPVSRRCVAPQRHPTLPV